MFKIKVVNESHDKEPKRFLKYEEAVEEAFRSENSDRPEIVVYY